MEEQLIRKTAQLENLAPKRVKVVIDLLNEGATVPFIARYRKEVTGSLDEVQIRQIQASYQKQSQLAQRKAAVIKKIAEEEKLTPNLEKAINRAESLQEVEDLYLPYKQKRQTKAQKARQAGLQPLADLIIQQADDAQFDHLVAQLSASSQLSAAEVITGAKEIVAEQISESAALRSWLRKNMHKTGVMESKRKLKGEDEKEVYQGYYDFSQSLNKLSGHQVLALNRGEKQGILRVKIGLNDDFVLRYLGQNWDRTGFRRRLSV